LYFPFLLKHAKTCRKDETMKSANSSRGIVLDEESFHAMISLERKRSERSQNPFLLMLLDVSRLLTRDHNGKKIGGILSTLFVSIRETDISGWYKNHSVIGIVFNEIGNGPRGSIVSTMLARVNGILYGALTFEEFSQISISHHIFPEEWDHDVPQRPSHPTLYPDVSRRERGRRPFLMMKRMIDVIGSMVGLVLFAPVFLIIAVATRLSSKGPVFFRQVRVGRYGTPFVFLKFRSMYLDNDPHLHEQYVTRLIAGQVEPQAPSGNSKGVYKLVSDPRVTRVGAFLRKTSLDELPQLWNVLKGEMSLVGPRPPIPYEVEAYQIWHRRRVLEAKPGITGLWQVSGRSRVKFDEMVRLDIRYTTARSIWLDIKILLRTPGSVILGDGAY
jgi:lipopolysaccharide/colanic/teichoic acid biosynthesis glycosyltransferase